MVALMLIAAIVGECGELPPLDGYLVINRSVTDLKIFVGSILIRLTVDEVNMAAKRSFLAHFVADRQAVRAVCCVEWATCRGRHFAAFNASSAR